jgi:hypothetical protein
MADQPSAALADGYRTRRRPHAVESQAEGLIWRARGSVRQRTEALDLEPVNQPHRSPVCGEGRAAALANRSNLSQSVERLSSAIGCLARFSGDSRAQGAQAISREVVQRTTPSRDRQDERGRRPAHLWSLAYGPVDVSRP